MTGGDDQLTGRPATVAVHPASALASHGRLFQALSRAFPLEVVALDPAAAAAAARPGYDGVILFDPDADLLDGLERARARLYVIDQRGRPEAGKPSDATPGVVTFTRSSHVNPYLRGRRIGDDRVGGAPALPGAALDEVLAAVGDGVIWGRRNQGTTDLVTLPPPALGQAGSLGDHLTTGCFAALLPLIQFVRDLTAGEAWEPPPLRADIILDDPNFLTLTYGWLDYHDLLAKARAHDFHASIATVPLDAWLARGGPRRLLAGNPERLSVSMHGNDHVHHELGQPAPVDHYVRLLAQARRRMDRLTAGGLAYDLVQIPPHNRCCPAAMAGMARTGYEAVSVTRNYRERAGFDDPVATGGWNPADITPDGLPVLVRRHLHDPTDDYPLRAFLGAPIVLYGHHEDAVDDFALLVEAAAAVNDLGPVQWLSLGHIMRTNHHHRRDGELLRIRPWSRRLHLMVPDGVARVRLELPGDHPLGPGDRPTIGATPAPLRAEGGALVTAEVPVTPGSTVVIELRHPGQVDYRNVPAERPGPWPVSRRMLVQARDRARPRMDPVIGKVRARRG